METTMQDDATELDQALEGGGQLDRVSIPPELSRAFADATLAVRRRALSKSVVIGLGFYLAFALGDAFAVPDRLELALTFRFAIILPLGLVVVCWLRRTRCALILQQVVACGFHLVVVALLALTRLDPGWSVAASVAFVMLVQGASGVAKDLCNNWAFLTCS